MGRIIKTLAAAVVGAALCGGTGFGLTNFYNKSRPREIVTVWEDGRREVATSHYRDGRWQTDGPDFLGTGSLCAEMSCATEEMEVGAAGVVFGTLIGGTLGYVSGRKREEKPVEVYD